MITEILTIEELKAIWVEGVLNKTNKVTKISEGSVLNGFGYGSAKLGQKVLKEVAILEAHLFPDSAYSTYLDNQARLKGIAPRKEAIGSSTFVRVFGDPGTIYTTGVNTFTGKQGIIFDLDSTITIGTAGYAYAKISSQTTGVNTNVDPLTIDKVVPIPTGHNYCINEYQAIGGRDFEDDDLFRNRIKEEVNILARDTQSYLLSVLQYINPNILRVFNQGLNSTGDLQIGVATVNAALLSPTELNNLIVKGEKYFSLNELKPDGLTNYGIKFVNITYVPVDVSFRADVSAGFNPDNVRKEIQVAMSKRLDHRTWKTTDFVDWVDLLSTVRTTSGIERCMDNYFFPNVDLLIPKGQLPIIRGFEMLDFNGSIITDLSGVLNPIFYPNEADFSFQASVLRSL